jgi:hypothetical protein
MTYLTGALVLAHRACPAWAWALAHRPEIVPPDPEPAVRREQETGRVATVARRRRPDGVMIEARDPGEAARATENAIAAGAATIFDAAALAPSGLFARADLLLREGDGWALIVVDAGTSPSAERRFDATFRAIAFAEAGYRIDRVAIEHLDRRYRRNGHLDPERLFARDEVTACWRAERHDEMRAAIDGARRTLARTDCPPCECDRTTRARRCPTFTHFHPGFPAGGTVYDLVSINRQRLTEALDRGVRRLVDWPADLRLTNRQRWQIETARAGRERIRRDRLRAFVDDVRYPCWFLDYETFQTPLPIFSGTWPWQQVPFQYSLHVLYEDGAIEHREFLWTDAGEAPIVPLVEALRRDVGDEGSVLVWWKGFEGSRNLELAEAAPHLSGFLRGLNDRMVDLMEPISCGLWVHPAFGGSTSIKKVLPVVAPELAYDALEIRHGAVATLRWKQCVVDDAPPEGVDPGETFAHLRAYCRRDTLGMVRIWQHYRELAGAGVADPVLAGAHPRPPRAPLSFEQVRP